MKLLSRGVIGGALLASAIVANAATFATFADPTIGQGTPTPMFNLDNTANTLTGGYNGISLVTAATTYSGVTLTMNSVATTQVVPGFYNLGAGTVVFSNGSDANILTINFAAGTLSDNGFGASDFKGNGVVFSGSAVTQSLTDEAFGFSFANPTVTRTGVSYTAAFTSSATPVPEPAALAVLGLGMVGVIRRRNRK